MWKNIINIFRRKRSSIPSSLSPKFLAQLFPSNPYTVRVQGWVTRDKCGRLFLHCRKPMRFKWFGEWSKGVCCLPPSNFPELKWEHEAIFVTLDISYDPDQNKVLKSFDK